MDDIKCLTNDELSMTLKNLGLKYGPITRATRGVFEKILRSHYRDINQVCTQDSVSIYMVSFLTWQTRERSQVR